MAAEQSSGCSPPTDEGARHERPLRKAEGGEITRRRLHCEARRENGFVESTCSYRYNGWEDAKSGTWLKGRIKKNWYNWDFRVKANAVRLPKVVQGQAQTEEVRDESPRPRRSENRMRKRGASTPLATFRRIHAVQSQPSPHNAVDVPQVEPHVPGLDLVQAAKYNLNDKDNMILLPCNQAYGIALKLPDHPYAHASYNADASDIVNQIKEAVNVGQKKHDITATNSGDFKKMLVNWQKRQYDKIVDHGEKIADDFVNGLTAPSIRSTTARWQTPNRSFAVPEFFVMIASRDPGFAMIQKHNDALEDFTAPALGNALGEAWPNGLEYRMAANAKGMEIADLIPNTLGYTIMSERLKTLIAERSKAKVEWLRFTLLNHKGRKAADNLWVANVLTVVDAIDRDRTVGEPYPAKPEPYASPISSTFAQRRSTPSSTCFALAKCRAGSSSAMTSRQPSRRQG